MLKIWAVAVCLFLEKITCFNLTVNESHKLISSSDPVEFLCHADVPITVCQISGTKVSRFFNLNKTPLTGTDSNMGRGLRNGNCGVVLNETLNEGDYILFTCRVRSSDGKWKYATSVVDRVDGAWRNFEVDSGPETILANPGEDVVINLTSPEPLEVCSFLFPGQNQSVSKSGDSYNIDNSQLAQGRCRLSLNRVDDKLNGFVIGQAKSANLIDGKRGTEIFTKELVVKAAPESHALEILNPDEILKEGDVINASCHVGSARPVARITWLLGDDIIRDDDDNDDAGNDDTIWWNYQLQNTSQTVSRTLSWEDNGKYLVCRVDHVALPGGRVDQRLRVDTGLRLNQQSTPAPSVDPPSGCRYPVRLIVDGVVLCVAVVAGVVTGIFFYRRRQNHTLGLSSVTFSTFDGKIHDPEFNVRKGSHPYITISEIKAAAVFEERDNFLKTGVCNPK